MLYRSRICDNYIFFCTCLINYCEVIWHELQTAFWTSEWDVRFIFRTSLAYKQTYILVHTYKNVFIFQYNALSTVYKRFYENLIFLPIFCNFFLSKYLFHYLSLTRKLLLWVYYYYVFFLLVVFWQVDRPICFEPSPNSS